MRSDIIIVGAGPAGLALARSLIGVGLQIRVIDKHPANELSNPSYDGRDIALTHGSKRILTNLGIWNRLPQNEIFPIHNARVLDGNSRYALKFSRQEANVDALGFIVSNHQIRRVLYEAVANSKEITLKTGCTVTSVYPRSNSISISLNNGATFTTSLLVAADSRFSTLRQAVGIPARNRDFGRAAIVCRMEHRAENHAVASECFQYGQTIAVLPLTNHLSSIVITVTTDWARKLAAMTEPTFTQWVTRKLNGQFETMRLVTDRFVYPLVAVLADRFAGIRTALIGDAAVGMHPVTAHGYNLGLSGQERLAQLVIDAHGREQDIGALNLLQQYAVHHRRVVLPLYLGTNSLVGLYTAEYRPTKILRKVLLHAANHCRPMRQVVIDRLVDQ